VRKGRREPVRISLTTLFHPHLNLRAVEKKMTINEETDAVLKVLLKSTKHRRAIKEIKISCCSSS